MNTITKITDPKVNYSEIMNANQENSDSNINPSTIDSNSSTENSEYSVITTNNEILLYGSDDSEPDEEFQRIIKRKYKGRDDIIGLNLLSNENEYIINIESVYRDTCNA